METVIRKKGSLIKRIKVIAKAWFKLVFYKRSPRAKARLEICSKCQYKKGPFCGECWCPRYAKAESEDDCPKGYW